MTVDLRQYRRARINMAQRVMNFGDAGQGRNCRRVASQTGLPLGSVFRISRCLLEPALPQ
jgi:hypothetical protein